MNQFPVEQETNNIQMFDDISSVLTYYGNGSDIEVLYITDLHLDHHIKFYSSENTMIRTIVENLYKSINFHFTCKNRIVLFGGDISSSHVLATKFYKTFLLRLKYKKYEKYKSENSDQFGMTYDAVYTHKLKEINDLQAIIEKSKDKLRKWIDYNKTFSRFTCLYEVKDYISSAHYKKKNLPNWAEYCIVNLFEKTQKLMKLKRKLEDIEDYRRNITKISLIEFAKSGVTSQSIQVFAVLGNHELTEFETVDDGIRCYRDVLNSLGINLLCNSEFHNEKFLIYGGTGFAKYNDQWNATSVICCPGFTREDELKEGDLFEAGYNGAQNYALQNNLCFICVSHYPPTDCLRTRNSKTIYFSGHNHKNIYIKSEDLILYADNQIGYTSNNIMFKKASWGLDINPYYYFEDGTYETTVQEYLQFYRYVGEYAGNGNLISKRCDKGTLYVVKSNGYYGFFIQGEKGISIVNGGKTKKICNSTNINWISENFNIVVGKYYKALAPLRKLQLTLSSELKAIGFEGTIHGCIVDIDFYNHILINPSNGELTFYYSDVWGNAQSFSSFPALLSAMEARALSSPYATAEMSTIKQIKLLFESNCPSNNNTDIMLNSLLFSQGSNYETEGLVSVSRTEGPYEASRKINALQRLFTGRVLRDFDVSLTEIQNSNPKKRKKNYIGCLCYFRDVRCLVTKDDRMDLLEFTELYSGKTHVVSLTEFRADIINTSRRFDAKLSYWETHSLTETYNKYPEVLVATQIEAPKDSKQKFQEYTTAKNKVVDSTKQSKKISKYKQKIGIVGKIDVLNYVACNKQAQYKCLICGHTWSATPNKFQQTYNNKCPNCNK